METVDHPYSLIVIDDEETIRNGLTRFGNWESVGFSVVATFEDGKEALDFLEHRPVDVVLTDIRMAEVSGLDLARTVAARWPTTIVVIMSGYQEFDYARRAIRSRVFDYLLKPIDMETLYNTFSQLRDVLAARRDTTGDEVVLGGTTAGDTASRNATGADTPFREREMETEGVATRDQYVSAVVQKSCTFIEDNYHRDLSLEDLASYVHLSPMYFCRLFKEQVGVTFPAYLTEVRVRHAQGLLETYRYRISEIAPMVGYRNTKYFTRVFKRYTGLTPTEYVHREVVREAADG